LVAVLRLASAASCAAPISTQADSDTPDFASMTLRELTSLEVFTAASRIPTELAKAPGTVYSFNREDFPRLGVRRVEDLFQYVPGFQLNQYRKRHRSIWARGMIDRYNDKMVLMVDGVKTRHLYYNHFELGDNFPIEKVERVEIIVGPASSLYGANAFAGIVSITTREFAAGRHTEFSAELGNHSRAKGTVWYSDDRLQMFASYLDQDAPFREDRRSFIGGPTLQPLDEDFADLFVKVRPVEGLTLSLDYQRERTPFLFIPDTEDASIENRPLTLSASYEAGDLEQGRLEAQAYYRRDRVQEEEIEQLTRKLAYREHQDADLAGLNVTAFRRFFDTHRLALGASWEQERASDMDFVRYWDFRDGFLDEPVRGSLLSDPGVRNDNIAIYAQDVWELRPNVTLTLGARYDDYDAFGGFFNYRGALVYQPNADQVVKLLYGTGTRVPSFREYLKVLEGTDFDPPTPDPEKSRTLELGYVYQWERASVNLTLFHNTFDDYIFEVPTPDGADEYFVNSEDPWQMSGVELLWQYRPRDDFRTRLSAAYLDAEDGRDDRLPYLARWTASLNLQYDFSRRAGAGLTVVYRSDRPDTNDYADDDSGPFTLVNLNLFGRIDKRWGYSLGVDNLFDKRVYDPAGDFGERYNSERSSREIWARLQLDLDL